ncbi:unnamed protein product, partial [Scytosiphon promiscuus]
MAVTEQHCTILFNSDRVQSVQQDDIVKDLEQPMISAKINGIKQAILLLLSGETMPRLLMSVIKGCLKEDSKELKKLVMMYWEVVKKYDAEGKLLPEMILVCNALRNDLNHPNEYVRGCTLRFLCKLREPELLEPLVPTVKLCLEHRHSYVRRNAALLCYYIHKNFGQQLLPDGPELIDRFIAAEGDTSARRSAFLFLYNEAEELAIDFLNEHMEDVSKFGDGFALLVLELCRKVCRRDPSQKSRFVRVLLSMLQSPSAAVSYEAAWTLVSLSGAPTAIRAAATTYAQLLNTQSDNNVKLIVLERLAGLKKHHAKVLQEVLMDILRALSSPNVDICRKTLEVAMDLVTPRNIEEVVQVLKREVLRTQESGMEKGTQYRTLLIQAIHGCATKFADVAESVVGVLMDFLNGEGAMDVILFVRSIVEQYEARALRPSILSKLIYSLRDMVNGPVIAVGIWILGEYCEDMDAITNAFTELRESNIVLSDGTYSTQTSVIGACVPLVFLQIFRHFASEARLRQLLVGGDIFLGSALSASLTKMTLRAMDLLGESSPAAKEMQIATLQILCGVAKVIEARSLTHRGAFADCLERVTMCCRTLLDPAARAVLKPTLLELCRDSFKQLLDKEKAAQAKQAEEMEGRPRSQPDDLINFRQLRSNALQAAELDIYDGDDISKATGMDAPDTGRLSHIYQLSGFADPVYAEACVTVHDYDIVLEMLVINRTPNTLTNLTVELSTMGDLRLVERPQSHTIGPLDSRNIRANIKVSSTETGHIFGTIVYENSSTAEKTYINLNDIHMDIMDYIKPASCSEEAFRSMWAEFEWENKVAVNTTFTDLNDFLKHLVAKTNTNCLTPMSSLDGSSSFLVS